jgi:hypothetical protein
MNIELDADFVKGRLFYSKLALQRPDLSGIFGHLGIVALHLGYLVAFPSLFQGSPCLPGGELVSANTHAASNNECRD